MGAKLSQSVDVFTTCPPSYDRSNGDAYLKDVCDVARWSDEAGCKGMLIYTDNGTVDPWMLAQIAVQNTRALKPLVAVQPAYMHPYTVAKMVATLGNLYGRGVCLNMVAGGFKNDLLALNDSTPHDRRYARLVEYTTIIQRLLTGPQPVTFEGEFYTVRQLSLKPGLPAGLFPTITVSGSSSGGIAAASALNAIPVRYPEPPERGGLDQALQEHPCGVRVGIIARKDEEAAWLAAHRRFPPDRAGEITRGIASLVSDSVWHRQLSELAAGTKNARSTYWLDPFQSYKTNCPYLVGSYEQVAAEVRRYIEYGASLFILDVPASEKDFEHLGAVFARAGESKSVSGRIEYMNILGISGFENAVAFKRANWPGLDERDYRIAQGHDAAAALVVEGVPVAAVAEERFNRKKHSGAFPAQAISYCLREAGLSIRDIDEIAHSFDYRPYRKLFATDPLTARLYDEVFSREALLAAVHREVPGFPEDRVQQISHHEAHAASAWLTSGWDECLIVVIDGMGEAHGCSVYAAREGTLRPVRHLAARDSIGNFYSVLTLHLGFDFNSDEYKVMGLAPYGDPQRFRPFFDRAVECLDDGSLRIAPLRLNARREERENYTATRNFLSECLAPARNPGDPLTQTHRDIAAALQECLNRAVLHICGHFARHTGERRLAMAGGVALNCVMNSGLAESGAFDEIYIQPAAGDDGSALGAALARSAEHGAIRNVRSPVPLYGPAYATGDIKDALLTFRDSIEVTRFETTAEACGAAAGLIARGHVIAWFRGRMEFGPRALGNRSILADPGHPEMRDRINAMVKKRESFRPFAPAVSAEQVHRWFEVPAGTNLPYMLQTVRVREKHRSELPAVTHVDGTARVQTVAASDNADFHMLLKAAGAATGREMVLNTSFNVKGQPIVNRPREAVETFLGTGIEFLFLENNLVKRRSGPLSGGSL